MRVFAPGANHRNLNFGLDFSAGTPRIGNWRLNFSRRSWPDFFQLLQHARGFGRSCGAQMGIIVVRDFAHRAVELHFAQLAKQKIAALFQLLALADR